MGTHLTHIKSNIKGGVETDLGERTLIVGRNGHGKSGLVMAIECALEGRSSEYGAIGQKLMTTVKPEKVLNVDAMTGDGWPLHFSVTGTTNKATKPKWLADGKPVTGKPAILLTSQIQKILAKNDDGKRGALQEIICGEVEEAVVKRRLADAYHKDWAEVWKLANAKAKTGSDALIAARAIIKTKLKETRALTKQELGERPQNAVLPETIEALKVQAKAAQVKADGIQEGFFGGDDEVAVLLRQAQDALLNVGTALVFMERQDATRCLCCRQELREDISQLRGDQATRLASVRAQLEAREAQRAMSEAAAEASHGPQDVPGLPEALAEVQAAEVALGEALATLGAVEAWEKGSAAKARAEGEINVLKAIEGALSAAIADALVGSVAEFETQGTAYLPEGEALGIQLWDGKKAVCRLGLYVGEGETKEFRTALCGAEKARMVAAIAGAWGARSKEALRVVLVDDVWLDRESLDALCVGLGQAVHEDALTQVYVCAVEAEDVVIKKGKATIVPWTPEGWLRVDLDALLVIQKANGASAEATA